MCPPVPVSACRSLALTPHPRVRVKTFLLPCVRQALTSCWCIATLLSFVRSFRLFVRPCVLSAAFPPSVRAYVLHCLPACLPAWVCLSVCVSACVRACVRVRVSLCAVVCCVCAAVCCLFCCCCGL
jgi:hypothetical protein